MASEAIYKSGQGYWTRMISASAFGLLIAQGTYWTWSKLGSGGGDVAGYVAIGAALVFFAGLGSLVFWLLGRNPRSVDFLIATEAEMRKVNWSTRREITNSTGVVIVTMLAIAMFCFVCDRAFAWGFLQVGVLDSSVLESE
ncbi:MAG: preprotein translocase subunit SecE [Planctomycetes bacterium]|nr:preprotein translocase subunit SecE [Planctomycetota bacterium]